MPKGGSPFVFASIGDLHVRDDDAGAYRDLFAKVSTEARALVLCGDLTDTGTPRQAEILAEDLKACSIPVVAVLGNHDYECGNAEQVRDILVAAGVHMLDGQSCQVDGVSFIGVKGFAGGFGRRMLSSFGEPVTKTFVAEAVSEAMRLENALRTASGPRAVVVLHYAPSPKPPRESLLRSSRSSAARGSPKPSTNSRFQPSCTAIATGANMMGTLPAVPRSSMWRAPSPSRAARLMP